MADFKVAAQFLKPLEGGYSTRTSDPGNFYKGKLVGTNHGVTGTTYAEYLGRDVTADDVKNMSYDTALKIYKKVFWDYFQGDKVNNQSVANLVFDGTVNQGKYGMANIYKNTIGEKMTADSINSKNQEQLFNELKEARKSEYNKESVNYEGWMKRINKYMYSGVDYVKKKWIPITLIMVGAALVVTTIIIYKNKKLITNK